MGVLKYDDIYNNFSWDEVKKHYVGDPDGKMNMAVEACDRWADDPERVAIYWEDELGNESVWTYQKLKEKSDRAGNLLRSLGIKKGDRIGGLLSKDMELVVMILASWKVGAIYVPLFTAFNRDAIMHRVNDADIQLLITNNEQLAKLTDEDISFQTLVVDNSFEGKDFWEHLDTFSADFEIEDTDAADLCLIQYTSGSTGLPKGALINHKGIYRMYPYTKYGLHIEDDDIFFGAADLGWSYGMMACTFAPMSFGAKIVAYKGQFIPTKIFEIMEKYQVTNFTYAPTAYRFMMSLGAERIKQFDLKVRKFSSAGEPLDAEVVRFFEDNFGRGIYDNYGATESGMIINNYNITDMEVRPGSMGFPMPGTKIVLLDEDGNEVKRGDVGQIAVELDEQYEFLGYWRNEEGAKNKVYKGKYLMLGDLARIDEDGYYWFQGRADDVILSAGYRIGPTEVEACLSEHPAVIESAAVGKPDRDKGEIVKAFVVLHPNFEPSDELIEELTEFVRGRLSKHQYPREIEFIDELPKTESGKIKRFILRNRESVQQ